MDDEQITEINKLANFENDGYWVHENWNVIPMSCFLNHSTSSNVTSVSKNNQKINFRAIRDIKKNEELLWNYYENGKDNDIY